MSGIIGKLSFERDETLARPVLEQMLDALADGSPRAIYSVPGIALGTCGTRPGTEIALNEHGTVRVVADAQLTNTAALRQQLESLGHRFVTGSDAELIAHASEQWGTAGFARLRGAFACAVWDDRTKRLLIARDHLGVRPIYFALLHNHGIVFASAIRALLHDPGVGRQFSPDAIDAYLTFGYVPAPLTAYRRISKLEPAQALVVEGRRFHVEQFWQMPAAAVSRSLDDSCAALDACTRRVIRRHVAGDAGAAGAGLRDCTPGVLYSGGVASSLLLASAPRLVDRVLTVDTGDGQVDVTRSDAAASYLGRRREFEDLSPVMPLIAADQAKQLEEPIADPGVVTQFALCAAASRVASPLLGAHGAAALWTRHGRRRLWNDAQRRALYTRAFAWQVRDGNPFTADMETADDAHTRSFIADNLLASAARAATATGVELRFPFVDPEFVELAVATRASLMARGRADVNPLHLVLGRYLPASLMPHTAPRRLRPGWLHTALAGLVRSVLLTPRFDGRGIVSRPVLAHLWEEHQSGRRDHAQRLWSLLVLEFWFREYMDGDAANEPLEYAVLKVA